MSLAQTPIKDPLVRARASYNASQYDQAIDAATEARLVAKYANDATLVLARARLGRFRVALAKGEQAPADLVTARDLLKQIDVEKLSPRDQIEYLTGVGVALYLEDPAGGLPLYGAAAEVFERALSKSSGAGQDVREPLFEWWASSLDRQAQLVSDSERRALYVRILERAEQELDRRDLSPSATYWIAAASRGADDVERAWGAAVAGWIRAPQMGSAAARLREDLDRLVMTGIVPDRARLMSSPGNARAMEIVLQQQWDDLKAKWAK